MYPILGMPESKDMPVLRYVSRMTAAHETHWLQDFCLNREPGTGIAPRFFICISVTSHKEFDCNARATLLLYVMKSH